MATRRLVSRAMTTFNPDLNCGRGKRIDLSGGGASSTLSSAAAATTTTMRRRPATIPFYISYEVDEESKREMAEMMSGDLHRNITTLLSSVYYIEEAKDKGQRREEEDMPSSLFRMMRDVISYNDIISQHMRSGEPEKVPQIVQEMRKQHIYPDDVTYNMLMKSYVSLEDIEGAERTMEEMKADGGIKCEWPTYAKLASIYIEAGLFDKADLVLNEIEEIIDRHRKSYLLLYPEKSNVDQHDPEKKIAYIHRRTWQKPYHVLICLYSKASNKEGVNRVWESLKSAFGKPTNISYKKMLQALARLGDTDGLKKYFEEYCELDCSTNDVIRAANVVIRSYLSQDMLKEAELVLEGALERGAKPNFGTLKMFMNFYLKKDQISLAVKYCIAACSKTKAKRWQERQDVVDMFFLYFDYVKDVDSAEKLFQSLKNVGCIDSDVYISLLRTYVAAGKVEAQMVQRIKDDGVEMNFEIEQLLEKVSPDLSNPNTSKEVAPSLLNLVPASEWHSCVYAPEARRSLGHFLIGLSERSSPAPAFTLEAAPALDKREDKQPAKIVTAKD